ncbi:hypothetical protein C1893_28575 [Pseudomonas sp. MPR-ANC1]|uniref:hypothetical protein n=1 Tax=Pseudomonas sp. MPR-ANC1 TaxID=2075548 RepID=UPI000CD1A6FF|nr:hypothetical protein [Pseudomonas sp. MPR-ANC1]POA42931.1 hypothetical protein C1893_28575 [Pseudomonas sp. MPR-ANC1]
MTDKADTQEESKVSTTAKHIVALLLVSVGIFIAVLLLCLAMSSGGPIAFSLGTLCAGVWIGVATLIFDFSQSANKKLTALGIFLSLAGYAFALKGAFYPVHDVSFPTDQAFTVNTDADLCSFKTKTGKLICPVSIAPK